VSGPVRVDDPRVALAWEQQAALVGAYRWLAEQLFERSGAWSTQAADPPVALRLADLSARMGLQAWFWAERLPRRDGVDADSFVAPLGLMAALVRALDGGGGPASRDADAHRLGGLTVVLDRLVRTYERHRVRAVPVSEGPVIEVLDLVTPQVRQDVEACRALLAAPPDRRALAEGAIAGIEALVPSDQADGCLFDWPLSALAIPTRD
jgi:hypothetical protein